MEACEIKEVRQNELEACAEVIRQSFGTVARDFGLTLENCPTNGAFIKVERLFAEREKGNRMYALYTMGKLTGFLELEKLGERLYAIEKLAVLPEHRHNGYGKLLLAYAKQQAAALGGEKISIAIIEENTVLKGWYIANGFIPTGTKVFAHLPFTVGFLECPLAGNKCI